VSERCSSSSRPSCCKLEALIAVDERGQMVLPKEIRKKAGIKPGDKLALITWENEGEICCLALMKADELSKTVRNMLGPIMGSFE